ncbi:hypothetical protein DAPPUDRAFT_118066 [Daphnia pulex]|uniref:Uncharacterized protein n=1 Tax=Daphnia pulex TaxID=6669 RepID=E9HUL1_DAPPU|nr:hypothetical protein DAPPUDRAFT_118066 [Daphnia pulex]|eukprot:EFX64569.1 hypothetical protein DAPPUDRAFT_118066 [Daphnia pulex]
MTRERRKRGDGDDGGEEGEGRKKEGEKVGGKDEGEGREAEEGEEEEGEYQSWEFDGPNVFKVMLASRRLVFRPWTGLVKPIKRILVHTSSVIPDDAIRHVTVLSNQVDSQIEKEHTGRASSVLSCCRSDAIHPVAVLSGQVDNQIIEGNTGRASSVISAADSNLFMTVLSNHVDSRIDEDNMAVPVQ